MATSTIKEGAQRETISLPTFTSSTFSEGSLRKYGSVVTLSGILSTTASISGYSTITTLPTKVRPKSSINFGALASASNKAYDLYIGTNGNLSCRQTIASGVSLVFTITYII